MRFAARGRRPHANARETRERVGRDSITIKHFALARSDSATHGVRLRGLLALSDELLPRERDAQRRELRTSDPNRERRERLMRGDGASRASDEKLAVS